MAGLFLMPEFAATDNSEATLSQWVVPVGEAFRASDTIVVVETAKAAVDVEADSDGVLLKTLVAEGAEVRVGDPIALLGAVGESVEDMDLVIAELGVVDGVVGTAPPAAADPPATPAPENSSRPAVPVPAGGKRRFASPLARRLAGAAGLELEDLVGTGPDGRIVRSDVELAKKQREQLAEPSASPTAGSFTEAVAPGPSSVTTNRYTEVPHTRLRRAIARRLTESVQTAPHFRVNGRATVDRLLALRAEINAATDVKVSVNDLVVKAVAHAHLAVPAMNVVWTADSVRTFAAVDVAVAVATDNGLLTPVLRGVDGKSVAAIGVATRDLAARARTGRLQQQELEGGTVCVTNLGMYGTHSFDAIINPPQSSILAVGAATSEPVVVDGAVVVASVLHLTVSVDHRPVDGATAAEWMRALVNVLENPLALLVERQEKGRQ